MPVTEAAASDEALARRSGMHGLAFAVGAYGLWGLLPIFFVSLAPASPVEIVAWRVVLSLVFCGLLIIVMRTGREFVRVLRDRRAMLVLALAGGLILVNWLVFVFGTLTGHVVETALGYFINPIVTVLLGVFVLRERLRPAQWAAIGLSGVAVVVLTVDYGAVPWIALALAASFGAYGLVKKRIGVGVDAITGLTMETLALSPLAAVALVVLAATTGLTIGTVSPLHTVLLASAGVVTAVPLLFFAAAARRLPLTLLGIVQYLAPVLQFLFGVYIMHEQMTAARWVGFAIVWLALAVFTVDLVAAARRRATVG